MTSLRRELAEWARNPGNRRLLHDEPRTRLEAALGAREVGSAALVAAWLLGTWMLGTGMLRVLDGDEDGFDAARNGQALRRTSLLRRAGRSSAGVRASRSALPFSSRHGAWTVLFGLALADPRAEPLYALFAAEPEGSFAPGDSLARFARALLLLRAGRRPPVHQQLGPYQGVVLHWDGDARTLGRNLAAALDFHLTSTHGPGASFADPPGRVYPLEIHAVRRVRDELDKPTPEVEHTLLATKLGKSMPLRPWPADGLVMQFERMPRGA